jgi:hypothetical protein
MMESSRYYASYSIFSFCFINHKLYEFDNEPMKIICVEHKTRMKVDHRNKSV